MLRGGLRPATPAGGWAAGQLACAVVAKIGCLRPSARVRVRQPHSGALALADYLAAVVAHENRFTSQCSSRDRSLRVGMLAKNGALFLDGYLRVQHRARFARTVGNVVVAQHCLLSRNAREFRTRGESYHPMHDPPEYREHCCHRSRTRNSRRRRCRRRANRERRFRSTTAIDIPTPSLNKSARRLSH